MEEQGLLNREDGRWIVAEAGHSVLGTYAEMHGDDDPVRRQLEGLHRYAKAVGASAKRSPDRADIVDSGRGYLGGALTTLRNLQLVSEEEHSEWWQRLMDELPPTNWTKPRTPD